MANEQRVRANFKAGTITNNPLLIGGTSLTSAELASLPVVGTTEHLAISLDPGGLAGAPEIVYVTAHTASSTTATIVRAQEGTTARQHGVNTRWAHSTTATDWDRATPVGMLTPFAGAAAPAGWLLCDGTAVSRTTYAALFAVTGTLYGIGDGSTTFNLPNLQGRMPVGLDAAQTEFDVRGESGGSKTATALHTHAMATHDHHMNAHVHGMQGHVHGLNNHVHGGNAHNHGLENHTHYTSTGGTSANHVHWNQNGVVAFFSDDIHNHAGGGGQLSESGGAVGGTFFGTNAQTTTENTGHVHGGESGWFNNAQGRGGAENVGNTGGSIANTTGNSDNTGGNSGVVSGAQNIGAAQGSSVGVASGNLPPYLVVNYIVKY